MKIPLALLFIVCASMQAQIYFPMYEPSTARLRYASCYLGNQFVPNCQITNTTEAVNNTNAHFHNNSRPKSAVSPASGSSGNSGLATTITGTIVGQAEKWKSCNPTYGCATTEYGVGYTDIYWVDNARFIQTGGNTTNHGGNEYNHWMQTLPNQMGPAYQMYDSCGDYIAFYGLSTCTMNDMALPFGGKFDINQDWSTSHFAHQRGRAADINNVPPANRPTFLQFCNNHGSVESLQEANGSLHCRF